jgi:hypothetical protein
MHWGQASYLLNLNSKAEFKRTVFPIIGIPTEGNGEIKTIQLTEMFGSCIVNFIVYIMFNGRITVSGELGRMLYEAAMAYSRRCRPTKICLHEVRKITKYRR